MVDDSNFDIRKRKGIINNKVREYDFEKWKERMGRKVTLKMYSEKSVPKRENFYDGDWGSRLLFRARTNSLEVGDRTYRFNDTTYKTCLRFDMRVDETVEYIMAECPAYEVDRERVIMEYKGFLGEHYFRDLVELEEKGLSYLLGITEDVPLQVVEITKTFLCQE